MNKEYITSRLIGTPLEEPAKHLRRSLEQYRGRNEPQWAELRAEDGHIDELLKYFVKEEMNCIDIGCHLGSILSLFGRYAPKGRHIAFEPLPYKAAWLRKRYPSVGLYEMALSDEAGTTTFYYQPDASGFSGLQVHGDANAKVVELTVEMRRLDEIVPFHRTIHFIKLDVEGAELLVLRGAEKLLKRDRPTMLFECTESGMTAFHYTAQDIYTLLADEYDYNIYIIGEYLKKEAPLTAESFAKAQSNPARAFNFVASPKEKKL
jgi:FkbM family methyltransferase